MENDFLKQATALHALYDMLEHMKELNYDLYCVQWAKLSKRFPQIMALLPSLNSTSGSVPL
jgi:hypothetical protein